jgi:hypothetical protein
MRSDTNHDAAPAARAEASVKEPNGKPEGKIRTGNTQE